MLNFCRRDLICGMIDVHGSTSMAQHVIGAMALCLYFNVSLFDNVIELFDDASID